MRRTTHFFVLLASSALLLLQGTSSEHTFCSSTQKIPNVTERETTALIVKHQNMYVSKDSETRGMCTIDENSVSLSPMHRFEKGSFSALKPVTTQMFAKSRTGMRSRESQRRSTTQTDIRMHKRFQSAKRTAGRAINRQSVYKERTHVAINRSTMRKKESVNRHSGLVLRNRKSNKRNKERLERSRRHNLRSGMKVSHNIRLKSYKSEGTALVERESDRVFTNTIKTKGNRMTLRQHLHKSVRTFRNRDLTRHEERKMRRPNIVNRKTFNIADRHNRDVNNTLISEGSQADNNRRRENTKRIVIPERHLYRVILHAHRQNNLKTIKKSSISFKTVQNTRQNNVVRIAVSAKDNQRTKTPRISNDADSRRQSKNGRVIKKQTDSTSMKRHQTRDIGISERQLYRERKDQRLNKRAINYLDKRVSRSDVRAKVQQNRRLGSRSRERHINNCTKTHPEESVVRVSLNVSGSPQSQNGYQQQRFRDNGMNHLYRNLVKEHKGQLEGINRTTNNRLYQERHRIKQINNDSRRQAVRNKRVQRDPRYRVSKQSANANIRTRLGDRLIGKHSYEYPRSTQVISNVREQNDRHIRVSKEHRRSTHMTNFIPMSNINDIRTDRIRLKHRASRHASGVLKSNIVRKPRNNNLIVNKYNAPSGKISLSLNLTRESDVISFKSNVYKKEVNSQKTHTNVKWFNVEDKENAQKLTANMYKSELLNWSHKDETNELYTQKVSMIVVAGCLGLFTTAAFKK